MTDQIIKYSYKTVPTLRRFSESNAFFRLALGPFGCVSADTEYLSPEGWKRIDQYVGGKIAQWHKDTNSIEFVDPIRYIVAPAEELIEFKSKKFTMVLSDEHRVPHYNYAYKFRVKTAAEIAAHPSRTTIPITFAGHSNDALGMSDDLIRFAVMMHADGHYPKRSRKALVTVRKERKKCRIRYLLSILGIDWDENTSPARPTETRFSFLPPYIGKRYNGVWWRASKRELAVVLDEIKHWDGLFTTEETRFFSTHKIDADFLQYAAHANGFKATITTRPTRKDRPNESTMFLVFVCTGDNTRNRVMIRTDNETGSINRVPAEGGKKYCFEVPTSFFIARCRDSVFITGNSGKSSASVIELLSRAQAQKPGPDGVRRSRWIVIRNTYRQLHDSTIKTFFQWLPPHQFGDFKQSTMEYRIKAFENMDCEVLFRALDRPDHVGNLLSLEVTGGWLNEMRECPWQIVDALQGRVGRYPSKREGGPSWWGLWGDSNPADTESKMYKYFVETEHDPSHAALFMQPDGLGPDAENLDNLPGGRRYYEQMAVGKDPEWVKVYCRGQWGYTIDGKPVYPEYHDETHCKEIKPTKYNTLYRGWDFGLTPCCVFAQMLPTGQLAVLDELCTEDMGIDQFSDEVVAYTSEKYGDFEIRDVGDPAGEQRAQTDARSVYQILHSKGILIEPGMQSLALRLECVKKPLLRLVMGKPGFVMSPKCKQLRKGFMGGYCFRRLMVTTERFTNLPDKNKFSHPHDALQYICTILFGGGLTSPYSRGEEKSGPSDFDVSDRSGITGY